MTDLHDGADLRERIDRAMSDLSAPAGLTETALTHGRRLRRRRRIVTAGSGLAAVAVIAALVVPALSGGGPSSGPGIATEPPAPSEKAPSPSADGQTPSLAPEDGSPFPELPAGWWDMPSAEMVAVLEALLPDGVRVVEAETRRETSDPDEPWEPADGGLHGILEGPDGPGTFQIILYGPDLTELPDPVTTTDAAGNEHTTAYGGSPTNGSRIKCRRYHDTCEPITDVRGDQIGHVASNVERGTSYFDVTLLGPDGGALYFYVADSTGEKPGYEPPTADAPPLTPDQLRSLAEDPAWTSYTP
jgi:hypothetical protein